jgi:hypothetical protein
VSETIKMERLFLRLRCGRRVRTQERDRVFRTVWQHGKRGKIGGKVERWAKKKGRVDLLLRFRQAPAASLGSRIGSARQWEVDSALVFAEPISIKTITEPGTQLAVWHSSIVRLSRRHGA